MSSTPTIFVSYRREDVFCASVLSRDLSARFPQDVFIDLSSIRVGEDFERRLGSVIKGCHIIVVVIAPQWVRKFKAKKAGFWNSERKDWVKFEIETGLKNGCHLLPVLVGGGEMPTRQQLPPALKSLSGIHGMKLSALTWEDDVYKLIKRIEELLGEPKIIPEEPKRYVPPPVVKPEPSTPPPPAVDSIFDSVRSIIGGGIAVILIIVVIAMCSDPGKARRTFDSAWNTFFPTPTPIRRTVNPMSFSTPRMLSLPTPIPSPTPWTCPLPLRAKFQIELCWTQTGFSSGSYIQTSQVSRVQWAEVMGSDAPSSTSIFCSVTVCASPSEAARFVKRLNLLDREYSYRIAKDYELEAYRKMSGTKYLDVGFRVVASKRNQL